MPLPDLSDRLAAALFQERTGDPVGPTAVDASPASHQPDRPAIATGVMLLPPPPPDGGWPMWSGCQRARRRPPMPIGVPRATNATLIQVTVNGVGYTVGLL